MNEKKENPRSIIEFTSYMTRFELVCALLWLPVHLFGLPRLIGPFLERGNLDEAQANLLVYAIGALFLLAVEFRFLRRDFDPLCDNFFRSLFHVLLCYAIMMALNMCIGGLISVFEYLTSGNAAVQNQNNEAIIEMTESASGPMSALALYLAPFVEEIIFRGAMFSSIRNRSRTWAYIVSMLAFSVYHVWSFAIYDPLYWIYIIQYLPASFALCRCYEKTNSIWGSYLLHMLVNFVSLQALNALEGLL